MRRGSCQYGRVHLLEEPATPQTSEVRWAARGRARSPAACVLMVACGLVWTVLRALGDARR